jgi:hypothetical protein
MSRTRTILGPRGLALAVIRQAVHDYRRRRQRPRAGSDQGSTAWEDYRERQDAEFFLRERAGEWAESRRVWTLVAGMQNERLRKWAEKEGRK